MSKEVDEFMVTSPTPSGEKRGIPRNIHWILIAILGGALAIVVLRSAVEKERRQAEIKEAKEQSDRKGKSGIDKKTDPLAIMAIQNSQEEGVEPKKADAAKLPPVPDSKGQGENYRLSPPTDPDRERREAARKKEMRDEAISSSQILALKAKGSGVGGGIADQVGRMASAVSGVGLGGETDPARARVEQQRAFDLGASESKRNAVNGTAFLQAQKAQSVGSSNPFAAAAASRLSAEMSQDSQWLQGQARQGGSQALTINRPASQSVVMQGTMIPVVLLTQINSDMPGQISAMTTADVYDSIRGNNLIIPRGSKLFGEYNSQIKIGQERALAAFTRLIRPDGTYINLLGMNAADGKGQSGLEGEVNNHFFKMFGASFMTAGLAFLFDRNRSQTVVIAGGTGSGGSISGAAGDILVDQAKRIGQRNQNIQPTITVQAGEKFFVVVNKDIDIPPYRSVLPGQ